MRRTILLLILIAMMVAMMAVSVVPSALAQQQGAGCKGLFNAEGKTGMFKGKLFERGCTDIGPT
jgi:hypothetical protein